MPTGTRTEPKHVWVFYAAAAFIVAVALFGWKPAHAATSNWSADMTSWNGGTIIIEDGDLGCGDPGWFFGAEAISPQIGGFIISLPEIQEGAFPLTMTTNPTVEASWIPNAAENCTAETPCEIAVTIQCANTIEDAQGGVWYDSTVVATIYVSPEVPWYLTSFVDEASGIFGDQLAYVIGFIIGLLAVVGGVELVMNWLRKMAR